MYQGIMIQITKLSLNRVYSIVARMVYKYIWRHPGFRSKLQNIYIFPEQLRHKIARILPQVITPIPDSVSMAITGYCNNSCLGCSYGEMNDKINLSYTIILDVLNDMKLLGYRRIKLYGGEPLLHPHLVKIVEHSISSGFATRVSTNGILLIKYIDDLYAVGLRSISIALYGIGREYDIYTRRIGHFQKLERSLSYARECYANKISFETSFVLMKPSCNIKSFYLLWKFALRYQLPITINLIQYSVPYFITNNHTSLCFHVNDIPAITLFVRELIELKRKNPEMITNTELGLRSIPDWISKNTQMRLPCDAYRRIWIGSDGSVQLCQVALKIGNVYQNKMRSILFGPEHRNAAKDAFMVNCPNCHCNFDRRIRLDTTSRKLYGELLKSDKYRQQNIFQ